MKEGWNELKELFESKRSFEEDFELENGRYISHCLGCDKDFVGHECRNMCKLCSEERLKQLRENERIAADMEKQSLIKEEFYGLSSGDIVEHVSGGGLYVITADLGKHKLCSETIDIYNPLEWRLISKQSITIS